MSILFFIGLIYGMVASVAGFIRLFNTDDGLFWDWITRPGKEAQIDTKDKQANEELYRIDPTFAIEMGYEPPKVKKISGDFQPFLPYSGLKGIFKDVYGEEKVWSIDAPNKESRKIQEAYLKRKDN